MAGDKVSGGGPWLRNDGILHIVCRWQQEFEKRGPGNDFRFWPEQERKKRYRGGQGIRNSVWASYVCGACYTPKQSRLVYGYAHLELGVLCEILF